MHQGEFGKYRIIKVLGMGGMSIVYLALDQTLNREVALKVLNLRSAANPIEVRRFQREMQIAQRLRHPNIIDIYEYGEIDHLAYLAMEFMPGGTLADRYASPMSLSLSDAAEVLSVIAGALDFAHGEGVLHRDLKLANILLDGSGSLTLSDFGLALMQDASRITTSGQTFGTPLYMSPEQVSGVRSIGFLSDVYSLGVIAYLLATGYFPFSGSSALMLLNQHLTEMPPLPSNLNPRLPTEIDDVLLKGLAKRPEDRFASAGSLARAFADVTADILATEIILLTSQPTPIMEPSSRYSLKPSVLRNGEQGADRDLLGDFTPNLSGIDLRRELGADTQVGRIERGTPAPRAVRVRSRWVVGLLTAAIVLVMLIGLREFTAIMLDASPTAVPLEMIATETVTADVTEEQSPSATFSPTRTESRTPSPTPTQSAAATERPTLTRTASSTRRPTATATTPLLPTNTRRPSSTPTRTLSSFQRTATERAEDSASATANANSPTTTPLQAQSASSTPTRTQQGAQPATAVSASSVPATSVPSTSVPPTAVAPTSVPATSVPPTSVPPTAVPPTSVPPTAIIDLPIPTIPLISTLLPGLLG